MVALGVAGAEVARAVVLLEQVGDVGAGGPGALVDRLDVRVAT